MEIPEHLKRADGDPSITPTSTIMPRVIVCTGNTRQVEAGDARPGDIITDELITVDKPISICGMVHYWAMYPEFKPGESNQPLWTALYNSPAADRPECRWNGKKKPAAAEIIKLAVYSQQIGLRVLVCQRSAVKAAKDVLHEIDQLGVHIYGPLWKLGSVKAGKTHLPTFEHVGFIDEGLASELASEKTAAEIDTLLGVGSIPCTSASRPADASEDAIPY